MESQVEAMLRAYLFDKRPVFNLFFGRTKGVGMQVANVI